jgi:transcriptional regulator with XRE-family HTH domain
MDVAALVRETGLVPPKTSRPPGPDEWAARRIRYERERLGWSTAELARRVNLGGVQLRQQQVWQIENGKPPRRLSVGEAAAFAKVFGISLAELMTPPPPEAAEFMTLFEVGRAFAEWRRDAGALFGRLLDISKELDALSSDEKFMIDAVIKWMVPGAPEAAEVAVQQLSEVEGMIAEIREAIAARRGPWGLIASMQDQVAEDDR